MQLSPLTALSPLDGRYHDKTAPLQTIFSEWGLLKYRLQVEVVWLMALADEPLIPEISPFSQEAKIFLQQLVDNFDEKDALAIKVIEKRINHDVKAVEYFLKKKLSAHPALITYQEFVHFACTSEDINNVAYALMLQTAKNTILLPAINKLQIALRNLATHYSDVAMLSRTHGQPASPTTLGKEFANFTYRLFRQQNQLQSLRMQAKMNGAVGNFNAHCLVYPAVNWENLSSIVLEKLGLTVNPYTTQIEPHDYIAELAHVLIRLNTILIDLSRDIWGYVALGYFQQQLQEEEIGSSTMPHKVNPIDFENAEGNLGLANALLHHLADNLLISRWQRDLSDSTRMRNLGTALGFCLVSYESLSKGLAKISPDKITISQDLNQHWEILAEGIQTMMRRHGLTAPYEALKSLTRGKPINQEVLKIFIQQSALPEEVKAQLLALTPENYVGTAALMAKKIENFF